MYWSEQLGRDDFQYGQFGENFTVQGMLEDTVFLGDTFEIGEAVVQVTQPRVPCFKLAHKMGDKKFQKQFLQSHRVGFYLRVLQKGMVEAGQTFKLVNQDPVQMSIRENQPPAVHRRQKC